MTRTGLAFVMALWACAPSWGLAAAPTTAPTSYNLTQSGPKAVTVSWTAVPTATRYVTSVTATGLPTKQVRSTATSVTLNGLPSTAFTFSTSAQNADGTGPSVSNTLTPSAMTLSGPPTGLTVTNAGTSASIRWAAVTNAVSYTVDLQDITTNGPITSKTTSILMAAFTGLTVGDQYTVTVRALDNSGNNTASNITFTAAALTAPSSAPASLTVTAINGTQSLATWTPVVGASAYQLYVGTNPTTLSAQPPIFTTSTSRTLTGLTSGTTYYLKLRPLNQAGSGPFSTPLSFLSMVPPAAPSVSVATGVLSATATWGNVSGAISYTLYSQAGSFTKATATAQPNATSPTVLSGLSVQSYGLGVSASNAAGEGALSAVQTFTPADLLAPTGLHTAGGPTSIQLGWTSAAGATSYEVGYNTGATFNAGTATIVSAASSQSTIASLTNEQTYSLAVRSVLGSARSTWTAAVQETPHAASTVLWRDARDLVGVTQQGCGFNAWSTWVYDPCNNPYSAATHITGNAAVGASAATTAPYRLSAGTYHIWALAWAQSTRTFRAGQGATMLSAVIPSTSPSWINMGSLTVDPTQSLIVDMPANGNLTNLGVYVRGVYLTQGTETPTYQPAGNGGDQIQNFAMPTGLDVIPAPGGLVAFWDTTSGATSYTLYYMTGSGTFTKGAATALTGLTDTAASLTGLGSNVTVQLAVASNFPNGESVLSPVISTATTALVPPTNVAATIGNGTATINWTPASGVTNYEVAYQTGTTFNPSTATIQTVSTPSLALSGLTNGQTYITAVRSVYGVGTSAWSTTVTFTPVVIYSKFYRDLRNFSGPTDISASCTGAWWDNPFFLYYNGTAQTCGTPSTANAVYGNARGNLPIAELPALSSTFNNLSGSYKIYIRAASHSGTPVTLRHNSQSLQTNLSATTWSTGYAWHYIGTLTMTPGVTFNLTMQRLTSAIGSDNILRGIYFTDGTDVPTCAPTGATGDQSNQACPQ